MIPRGLAVDDDMNRSYQLLPNVLFVISFAIRRKNLITWLFAALGIFYTFSLGTRGPVLVIFVFIFSSFLLAKSVKKSIKIIVTSLFLFTIIVFVTPMLRESLLTPLNNLLKQLGLSTRIIDSFLYEKVSSSFDSGRSELYAIVFKKLLERPLIGYGVYGEWQWIGWTAHNIFLEILIHYGFIFGIVLISWVLINVITQFLKTKNDISRNIILIFICFVFVRGLIGGSYLSYGLFFLMAFCTRELSRRKRYV